MQPNGTSDIVIVGGGISEHCNRPAACRAYLRAPITDRRDAARRFHDSYRARCRRRHPPAGTQTLVEGRAGSRSAFSAALSGNYSQAPGKIACI